MRLTRKAWKSSAGSPSASFSFFRFLNSSMLSMSVDSTSARYSGTFGMGEAGSDLGHRVLDQGGDRLLVPALEPRPGLLVDLPELLEDGFEPAAQFLVLALERLELAGRELLLPDHRLELGERRRRLVDDRDEIGLDEHPHLDLDDGEAVLGRLGLEPLEQLFLLGLLLLDDLVALFAVVRALEKVGDVAPEILDQAVHGRGERGALSGRKHEERRLVRGLEVVDVEQVVRRPCRPFPGSRAAA